MILPWITLAAVQAAFYTRLSRGQLLDTLDTDNLPVIIGFVIVAAAFVVVANIIVDLVYALLDPRSGSPEAR